MYILYHCILTLSFLAAKPLATYQGNSNGFRCWSDTEFVNEAYCFEVDSVAAGCLHTMTDPQQCADFCDVTDGCTAYVYYSVANECKFIMHHHKEVHHAGATSCEKASTFEDVDASVQGSCRGAQLGHNPSLWYTKYWPGSLDECERLCSRDVFCKAYEYVSNSGQCELWNTVPRAVHAGVVGATCKKKAGDDITWLSDDNKPQAAVFISSDVAYATSLSVCAGYCKSIAQCNGFWYELSTECSAYGTWMDDYTISFGSGDGVFYSYFRAEALPCSSSRLLVDGMKCETSAIRAGHVSTSCDSEIIDTTDLTSTGAGLSLDLDEWITITLGTPIQVVMMMVHHEAESSCEFVIEVSTDKRTWSPACDMVASLSYPVRICTEEWFPDIAITYVRVRGHGTTNVCGTDGKRFTISGVRVYSCEACHTLSGHQCIFPFWYGGVRYDSCSNEGWIAPWCPMAVTTDGAIIAGLWGECADSCSKARWEYSVGNCGNWDRLYDDSFTELQTCKQSGRVVCSEHTSAAGCAGIGIPNGIRGYYECTPQSAAGCNAPTVEKIEACEYIMVGDNQWCIDGYLRGNCYKPGAICNMWDWYAIGSLEACKRQCDLEADCKFFALYEGTLCSRFNPTDSCASRGDYNEATNVPLYRKSCKASVCKVPEATWTGNGFPIRVAFSFLLTCNIHQEVGDYRLAFDRLPRIRFYENAPNPNYRLIVVEFILSDGSVRYSTKVKCGQHAYFEFVFIDKHTYVAYVNGVREDNSLTNDLLFKFQPNDATWHSLDQTTLFDQDHGDFPVSNAYQVFGLTKTVASTLGSRYECVQQACLPKEAFVAGYKGCHPALGCLDTYDNPISDFSTAWRTCSETFGCGVLLKNSGGGYILRRRSDPDTPANGWYIMDATRGECEACQTWNGVKCKFPFKYMGVYYDSCTLADAIEPWCATEVDLSTNEVLQSEACGASCSQAYILVSGNYACTEADAACIKTTYCASAGSGQVPASESGMSSFAGIGVTCCDANGVGSRPGCKYGNYQDAVSHCTNQGLRLCTAAELKSGVGEGTGGPGCDIKKALVWTSDLCTEATTLDCDFFANTNDAGGSDVDIISSVLDSYTCAQHCKSNILCQYSVYGEADASYLPGTCWLKNGGSPGVSGGAPHYTLITCAEATTHKFSLAIDVVADAVTFQYAGEAWSKTAPYADTSGNRLLEPFFAPGLVGVRIESGGMAYNFMLEDRHRESSLQDLVIGTPVVQEPCDNNTVVKAKVSAMSATSVPQANLWNFIDSNLYAENLYCSGLDRLAFNGLRETPSDPVRFRIGIFRDQEVCCAKPGSVDGIGQVGVASGARHKTVYVFHSMKVYAIFEQELCKLEDVLWKCPLAQAHDGTVALTKITYDTWQACARRCLQESDCQYWTWIDPAGGSPRGQARECWLKTGNCEPERDTGVISGRKFCEARTWSLGFNGCPRRKSSAGVDFLSASWGIIDFQQCANLCVPPCNGFEINSCTRDRQCHGYCFTFNQRIEESDLMVSCDTSSGNQKFYLEASGILQEVGIEYGGTSVGSEKTQDPETCLQKLRLDYPQAVGAAYFDKPEWAQNCFFRSAFGDSRMNEPLAIHWTKVVASHHHPHAFATPDMQQASGFAATKRVVQLEGASLADYYVKCYSFSECTSFCDGASGCNSFAYDGCFCFLKDKCVTVRDPIVNADAANAHFRTYYRLVCQVSGFEMLGAYGCDNYLTSTISQIVVASVNECANACSTTSGCLGFGYGHADVLDVACGDRSRSCFLWSEKCIASASGTCLHEYQSDQHTDQAPTTVTSTVASTTVLVPKFVRGELNLVVSEPEKFVAEPNVVEFFTMVIAELYNVTMSWVTEVEVNLLNSRRLLEGMGIQGRGNVGVAWKINIPPDQQDTIEIEVIAETFDAKTMGEATQAISVLLNAGYLGANPYDVDVTWKYTVVDESNGEEAPPTEDSDSNILVIVISVVSGSIGVCLLMAVMFLILYARQTTKKKGKGNEKTQLLSFKAKLSPKKREEHLKQYRFAELMDPPEMISAERGAQLREWAGALMDSRCGDALDADVFISFSPGPRQNDAEGYGPGTFFAAAVLQRLEENGISCFCELMLPDDGTSRHLFAGQMFSRSDARRVVIVIQTKALYGDKYSLKELYAAQQSKCDIVPLRFEADLPSSKEVWPSVTRNDMEGMLMVAQVADKFCNLNSVPSPPYTVVNQPFVLDDLITDLKIKLQTNNGRQDDGPLPVSIGINDTVHDNRWEQGSNASNDEKPSGTSSECTHRHQRGGGSSSALGESSQILTRSSAPTLPTLTLPSASDSRKERKDDRRKKKRKDQLCLDQSFEVAPSVDMSRGESQPYGLTPSSVSAASDHSSSRSKKNKGRKADSDRALPSRSRSDGQKNEDGHLKPDRSDSRRRKEKDVPKSASDNGADRSARIKHVFQATSSPAVQNRMV